MSVAEKLTYTPEEYLERERRSDTRHELVNGEIYATAGGSRAHSTVTVNLTIHIGGQLDGGPCQLFSNDMKVAVTDTGLYAYPDLSGLCGEPLFLDEKADVLVNPSLIVEVLSPSTEAFDRGAKFSHYQRLSNVREYLLVSQDQMQVELFTAEGDGTWRYTKFTAPEQEFSLTSIGAVVSLRKIYSRVVFPDQRSDLGPTQS